MSSESPEQAGKPSRRRWLVALLPLLGNHGLWAALLISFVARGITLGLRYPALEAEAER